MPEMRVKKLKQFYETNVREIDTHHWVWNGLLLGFFS